MNFFTIRIKRSLLSKNLQNFVLIIIAFSSILDYLNIYISFLATLSDHIPFLSLFILQQHFLFLFQFKDKALSNICFNLAQVKNVHLKQLCLQVAQTKQDGDIFERGIKCATMIIVKKMVKQSYPCYLVASNVYFSPWTL